MTPQRIQLSRAKGWRMPADTVNVARPGRWGNHWAVWRDVDAGEWVCTRNGREHHPVPSKEAGIAMAVERHAEEMRAWAKTYGATTQLLALRGKNLACWCKSGAPCHADVLLQLANEPWSAS